MVTTGADLVLHNANSLSSYSNGSRMTTSWWLRAATGLGGFIRRQVLVVDFDGDDSDLFV